MTAMTAEAEGVFGRMGIERQQSGERTRRSYSSLQSGTERRHRGYGQLRPALLQGGSQQLESRPHILQQRFDNAAHPELLYAEVVGHHCRQRIHLLPSANN